jgi:hypothetical protein
VRIRAIKGWTGTLHKIEAEAKALTAGQRLQMRQARWQPLWDALHVWT